MQLNRIAVQVQKGSNHSWEETNRGPWVCIRYSVYVTVLTLDVNLRKLGRDNQEQNGPLVEIFCNIYGIQFSKDVSV